MTYNIACVYKTGHFRGREYSFDDVIRLYHSVKRHMPNDIEPNFYCLTDCDDEYPEIKKIKLNHNWPGWWSKMELGREDLPQGRTLYLDLDTSVVNNLHPILNYEGDLVMFDCRIPDQRKPYFESRGWICRYQNATILFDAGDINNPMHKMYRLFAKDPEHWMKVYRGDQDIMGNWFPNQPTFPREWMIKRQTCTELKEIPKQVIIVTGQVKRGDFREVELVEEQAR